MNIAYISLAFDVTSLDKEFSIEYKYIFKKHTRFICHYFSKKIRKERYKTDGTYNMISINPALNINNDSRIIPFNVLKVEVLFNKMEYEKIKGSENCNYYLELLEQGFKKASKFKLIPIEALLNLIEEFRIGGCKNEWLHKKKRFKEHDLEVLLRCEFTTNYFQLVIVINQISTKNELIKGVIMKTEPDEVIFENMFKNIEINNNIIITDKTDTPRISINKEAVYNGDLKYKILGDEVLKKILSYKLDK